jgi:hypothetical protein
LFTDTSDGHVIVGASISLTTASNEHVAVVPAPSVTTNVCVVVPTTNSVLPLARPAVCAVTGPAQLSVPTGVEYVTVVLQRPALLLAAMFAGQLITGASLSATTTPKLQLTLVPASSTACHVSIVSPST